MNDLLPNGTVVYDNEGTPWAKVVGKTEDGRYVLVTITGRTVIEDFKYH